MKKSLQEQQKRIFEIMSQMDKNLLLTELNEKYLDKILDKINQKGYESLSQVEKEALSKFSQGEDVKTPEPEKHSLGTTENTLRFTAARESTVIPKDHRKLFGRSKYGLIFIAGKAEELAGNHTPILLDGDMSNLDKDPTQQDIRMIIPKGEYECIAITDYIETDSFGNHFDEPEPCYYLILKPEMSEFGDDI